MMDNRFILFFTPSSVIENRNRSKVQQAINALNETEKMIQGKISARDEAIRIIREDIKRKRDNNTNNNNSSIINNKQYLIMQMTKLKQHINSKDIYYSTLLKIFSMKLKIDDAKAYNQINEGLKLCVHGMKHLISDDKLREMEDTLEQIDEQNQNMKYIESSMNQLKDIIQIDETNKMNDMNNNSGIYDDDSIWMDELNNLMATDDDNDNETTDVVKKVMRIDNNNKKNNITNYSYVSPLNHNTKILSTATTVTSSSINDNNNNKINNKKEDKVALLKNT